MMGLEFQRVQIDVGIFPDLVVDESLKHQREEPLERALLGVGGSRMRRAFEKRTLSMECWS